jgi:hypothetical protein
MEISGPFSQPPSYQQDFAKSVDLFDKSFQGMQTSTFDAQKQQYVKTMQDCLKVMQDAASGLVNKHLADLKGKLSNDLASYLNTPTDANKEKVLNDIETLKHEGG